MNARFGFIGRAFLGTSKVSKRFKSRREELQERAIEKNPAHLPQIVKDFLALKKQNPEFLLLFRCGDFYECFLDDAKVAAEALQIVLTRYAAYRFGDRIPFCGIPYHALNTYLCRLVRKGIKVAIAEQSEIRDPTTKKFTRFIKRLVTPGTLMESDMLEPKRHNFICSIASKNSSEIGLAWCDISTGEAYSTSTSSKHILSEIAALSPTELLISPEFQDSFPGVVEELSASKMNLAVNTELLKKKSELDSTWNGEDLAKFSLNIYVQFTQKNDRIQLDFATLRGLEYMLIDVSARKSLELDTAISGGPTLFDSVDLTVTAFGARLLKERLLRPLVDSVEVNKRLDDVEFFLHKELQIAESLRRNLRECGDISRSFQRLKQNALLHSAELITISHSIRTMYNYAEESCSLFDDAPSNVKQALSAIHNPCLLDLCEYLDSAIDYADDNSNGNSDNFTAGMLEKSSIRIKPGFNVEYDEIMQTLDSANAGFSDLSESYLSKVSVNRVKIDFSKSNGWFVEIYKRVGFEPPSGWILVQDLTNRQRFKTPELISKEQNLQSSVSRLELLRHEILKEVVDRVYAHSADLQNFWKAAAALDVASSFAKLARDRGYCRPIVDDSQDLEIHSGRHPVIESRILEDRYAPAFTPNDCMLNPGCRFYLLTGPNMAGKSTFIRQVGIICILAQCGSFVPASSARIGIIDKLFSRVGSSDDISSDKSSFMVEMLETASILHHSTSRSLVLMDEVGRGTAVYDGFSIALAVLEELHDSVGCRGLFSTHYHELADLAEKNRLPRLKAFTMKVVDTDGQVSFLHKIVPGKANESYGIHVAELAKLPTSVVQRAAEILGSLEDVKRSHRKAIASLFPPSA